MFKGVFMIKKYILVLAPIVEKLDYDFFFFAVIHLECNISEKPYRVSGKITLRIDKRHWTL